MDAYYIVDSSVTVGLLITHRIRGTCSVTPAGKEGLSGSNGCISTAEREEMAR